MRWLDNITESDDMNFSKLWEIVKYRSTGKPEMLQSMGFQRVREDSVNGQQHQPVTKINFVYLVLSLHCLIFAFHL